MLAPDHRGEIVAEDDLAAAGVLGGDDVVLGMLLSTRYALQSMGEKVLPLLSSVIEFLGKIVFVLLFIPRFEYNAVILCEPVIWCFMTIELLIAYRHNSFVFPKMKK